MAEAKHYLSGLAGHRLRTHGGVFEQRVPFIISAPLSDAFAERAMKGGLRSYEIFGYVLNGVSGS